MKKIVYTFALLGIVALTLHSCKKEDNKDLERPVIQLSSPGDDTLNGGEILEIRGTISDNEGLSQVKIEIHDDIDGHTHLKKPGAELFAWDTIINLSGKSANLSLDILLPEDLASGPYHLLLMALDASGNEANFEGRDLYLWNAFDQEAPQIISKSTVPAMTGHEVAIAVGGSVQLMASFSDNLNLEEIELILVRESDEKVLWDKDIEASGTSFSIDETINFDPQWTAGEYGLVIKVKDEKGNTTEEEIHVIVQ